MIRFVFRIKEKYYLGETKKLRGDSHDTCTVKSKSVGHSRSSTFSTLSTKLNLIERQRLRRQHSRLRQKKQTLRLASLELELWQQIVEAKS